MFVKNRITRNCFSYKKALFGHPKSDRHSPGGGGARGGGERGGGGSKRKESAGRGKEEELFIHPIHLPAVHRIQDLCHPPSSSSSSSSDFPRRRIREEHYTPPFKSRRGRQRREGERATELPKTWLASERRRGRN